MVIIFQGNSDENLPPKNTQKTGKSWEKLARGTKQSDCKKINCKWENNLLVTEMCVIPFSENVWKY